VTRHGDGCGRSAGQGWDREGARGSSAFFGTMPGACGRGRVLAKIVGVSAHDDVGNDCGLDDAHDVDGDLGVDDGHEVEVAIARPGDGDGRQIR